LPDISTIRDVISEAPNEFKSHITPIFKLDCDGKPYHAGTAFGVEANGKRHMVTAAHVLDRDEDNPCDSTNELFVVTDGTLKQILHFDKKALRTSHEGHSSSEIDLVLVTPKDFAIETVFGGFFSSADFFWPDLHEELYVAACGFPSTKNSTLPGNSLANRPFGYFGRISGATKCEKTGFDPATHFCFDILLKKTFRGKLREIKAPKPHGISGGPVLVVHDFSNALQHMKPKLRGVIIENAKKYQSLVCIDLRPLFDQF
jgi:hypothetical protein